jgi:plastocyanin
MKLIYTTILALLLQCSCSAKTWTVTVANFSFSPVSINALVGDVIQFEWASGIHTTTCGSGLPGTSLPAGAAEWDSPLNASNTTYSYTLTVAGNYLYGCSPHFIFGMQGNITVSGVLPVKFGSFDVISNANNASLKWKTFTEVNSNYFSIRKSSDGSNFYEIGMVKAAGNSSITQDYQFEDTDLGEVNQYIYYEVVTIDADRKESFSEIKTFRNGKALNTNLILSLSPNPITRPGQVQIKFNADKNGQLDVAVYNSGGQVVLKSKMAAFYGVNKSHLHICDLEKGTYNIMFRLGNKRETKRVVVL